MIRTVRKTVVFFAAMAVMLTAVVFLLPSAAFAAEEAQLTLTSADASPVYGDDLNFTFDAQADTGSGLASLLDSCTAEDFELWHDGAAVECTIDTANKTIVCTDDISAGDNTFTLKYIGTVIGELSGATADSTVNIAKAVPNATAPTATAITYGQTLAESALSDGWSWANEEELPAVANSGFAAVMTVSDDNNYDYSNISGYAYDASAHTLTYTVPVDVSKATPEVTVIADLNVGTAGDLVDVTVTAVNPNNDALADVPTPALTYKVGDGAAQSFDISFNIPADAAVGAAITITAQTEENENYAAASGATTVMVAPAAPIFDPADGTSFKKDLEISITCDAQGAAVYYTTDGTEPTNSSTPYTAPFTINANTTVKAVAFADGIYSEVVSATYTKKVTSDSGSAGGGGGGGGYGGGHFVGVYTPSDPDLNGEPMSWIAMAEALAKLPFGSEVTIQLHGNYEVPVEVITAIADNELKVTFIVDNARSWFTDGADIETPCAADLRVVQNKDIDAAELTGLVGTRFSVDGTNLPTDLITSFRKKHGGKFAYLYQKTDSGFVFDSAAKIGEDGKVSFPLSEGGDYVIMIKEHSPVFGDVNDDGLFTSEDAWAVLMDYVEFKDAPNPEQLDFNGDGKLTPADASAIARALL